MLVAMIPWPGSLTSHICPRHFRIMALELSKIGIISLVCSQTWIIITWSSANSMKMCVPKIFRPSSKTSHLAPVMSDLWPIELSKIDLTGCVCSHSQTVFNAFSPNFIKMLVAIISWPSSITSHIDASTSRLWPLIYPKLALLALFSL